MRRQTSYLSKPSEVWLQERGQLSNLTLLLVARPGPTIFHVQEGHTGRTFKVALGDPHTCNCTKRSKPCVHMLYCILKVLRIPEDHPLSWQTSYSDNETTQVLAGIQTSRPRQIQRSIRKVTENGSGKADDGYVQRQLLGEEEELCPICQDEMTNEQALSWCRQGCGNNVHAKCMQSYAQFKISQKTSVECPLCREPWVTALLRDDCRGKGNMKHSCATIKCSACSITQKDAFHRCIECSQHAFSDSKRPVDLCGRCFTRYSLPSIHSEHHFVQSDASVSCPDNVMWTVCKNPREVRRIDPELLDSLQNRELTQDDYDALLALDRDDLPDLMSHLLASLSSVGTNQPGAFCWCQLSGSGVTPQTNMGGGTTSNCGGDLKLLHCGHVAHLGCIEHALQSSDIFDGMLGGEMDTSRVCELRCGHSQCKRRLFGGLVRKLKKKRPQASENEVQDSTTSKKNIPEYDPAIHGHQAFGVLGNGIVVNALSAGNGTASQGINDDMSVGSTASVSGSTAHMLKRSSSGLYRGRSSESPGDIRMRLQKQGRPTIMGANAQQDADTDLSGLMSVGTLRVGQGNGSQSQRDGTVHGAAIRQMERERGGHLQYRDMHNMHYSRSDRDALGQQNQRRQLNRISLRDRFRSEIRGMQRLDDGVSGNPDDINGEVVMPVPSTFSFGMLRSRTANGSGRRAINALNESPNVVRHDPESNENPRRLSEERAMESGDSPHVSSSGSEAGNINALSDLRSSHRYSHDDVASNAREAIGMVDSGGIMVRPLLQRSFKITGAPKRYVVKARNGPSSNMSTSANHRIWPSVTDNHFPALQGGTSSTAHMEQAAQQLSLISTAGLQGHGDGISAVGGGINRSQLNRTVGRYNADIRSIKTEINSLESQTRKGMKGKRYGIRKDRAERLVNEIVSSAREEMWNAR